jgi:hypothetical protein
MGDYRDVVRRLDEDGTFAAEVRADPRRALAAYNLDADDLHRLASQLDVPASSRLDDLFGGPADADAEIRSDGTRPSRSRRGTRRSDRS